MSVATEEMSKKMEQTKRDFQVKQDEANARRDMTAKRVREQAQESQTRRGTKIADEVRELLLQKYGNH